MNYFWGESTPAPAAANVKTYKSVDEIDFHAFADETLQILLARHSGDDKVTTWELVDAHEEGDVKIWQGAVEGSSWSPFRASRRISADKVTIQNSLLDPVLLLKLDDMMDAVNVLKAVDEEGKLSLRQIVSKGVFPVAAREFVLVTYATALPDGRLVIASRSIPLEGVPLPEGAVRGENIVTGYIIQETTDANGKPCCDVTLLAHVDLSGYIPATIVNMLGTSSTIKLLDNLEAVVEVQA
uniref:START domain-containing protein n=1 Tax=Globisporangium ultimum (strain ATCC 200006 / CBS 805.95 / DAOM BR144) TaxID=431595 RepID=K3WTW2_GLOUD